MQGRLHKELTAPSPTLGVYLIEKMRTLACLETKTTTLLQVEPGRAVTGHEIVSDLVSGSLEVFARVRAFFHTVAYVCIGDPTMFDLQTGHTVSDNIFTFTQRTYHGRPPPA